MDEPDDLRVLRTEEGYLEEETIELDDDLGTVTYKYNQKTIPINDEVESYIVDVKAFNPDDVDTLFFVSSTPEELLPEVDEMMVCSFRERFPHAFCHRCIERTEENGIYRCLFTKCGLFEAFDDLKVNIETDEIDDDGIGTPIYEEELDSIMNDNDYSDEPAAARSRWQAPGRRKELKHYGDKLKAKEIDLGTVSLDASIGGTYGGVQSQIIVGGKIGVGAYYSLDIDKEAEYMEITYGLYGEFTTTMEMKSAANVTFTTPVAIPILGIKADIGVAGIEAGLTCSPYCTISHYINAKATTTLGLDLGLTYTQQGKDKEGTWSFKKRSMNKKAGKSLFYGEYKEEVSDGVKMGIEAGLDFRLGLGIDVFGFGANIAAGVKVYSSLDCSLDRGKYTSATDFKAQNADFPTWCKGYVTGGLSALKAGIGVTYETPAEKCKNFHIPFFPVYEKGKIYCSRLSPQTYTMNCKLSELGLIGMFWNYLPKMRIYDKATGDLEHTFDMKWKEGSGLKEFSAESKCDKLKFNREYTAQVSMDSGYGYVVPIEDIYLLTQVPNIKVFDMEIVQTATPKKAATYEELQNRTIVGQHPTTGELAWMFKNKAYRYRYKIDIMLEIEAPRLIKKWGLHLGDIYANSTEFEHKEKDKKSVFLMPTVRMTWYANSSSVSLYAYPFAQIQDENGNVSKDLKKYESWSGVVNYQEFLDKPFSMTDEQPNYEKSRTATSWDANPVDFSFDPEASDFEIEYITE